MPSRFSEFAHRFHDDLHEMEHVLHLSIRGLLQATALPQVVDVLAEYDATRGSTRSPAELEREREEAKAEAAFAAKERERGFPVLYGHAAVALWAALETVFEDAVVATLQDFPELLREKPLAKITIPLGEYEVMTPEERLRYLVRQISRNTNADLKRGAGRFEAVLECVGMGGKTDAATRRDLLELSYVRNLLVHRRGIVDHQFVSGCPWLNSTLGERFLVTEAHYKRYSKAVGDYFVELLKRDLARHGLSTEGFPSKSSNEGPHESAASPADEERVT